MGGMSSSEDVGVNEAGVKEVGIKESKLNKPTVEDREIEVARSGEERIARRVEEERKAEEEDLVDPIGEGSLSDNEEIEDGDKVEHFREIKPTTKTTINILVVWKDELYSEAKGKQMADQIMEDAVDYINTECDKKVQINKVHLTSINQAQLIGVPTQCAQAVVELLEKNPKVESAELDREISIF